MANTPNPLPKKLQGRIFTSSEAYSLGVSAHRLRRQDLVGVAHNLWAPANLEVSKFEVLRAVVGNIEGAWLSHAAAATLYQVPLPHRLQESLHVSTPLGTRAPEYKGIVGHQRRALQQEVTQANGIRVSSPERVFLELAQLLKLNELVCAGDSLVRQPRPEFDRGRKKPWTTVNLLHAAVDRHQGKLPHKRKLLEALSLVRVGSYSPTETLCRLAIIRAGLPEPTLQIRLEPGNPHSPTGDLGYQKYSVVIQYDDANQFNANSQTPDAQRDTQRDAAFRQAGWRVLTIHRDDQRDDFKRIIRELRGLVTF